MSLINQAEPYLTGLNDRRDDEPNSDVPNIVSIKDAASIQIAEVDEAGLTVRVIIYSDLTDGLADFDLFFVPKLNYHGFVYVRSLQDANADALIVYPLEVATGKLSAAVHWVSNDCFEHVVALNGTAETTLVCMNETL